MYLDGPDIDLLDDEFERMAPLFDSRMSELLVFSFDKPDTRIQLSKPWHFESEDAEPLSYLAELDRTLNGIRTKTVQQAYDEADAQAEERLLLDAIETANESLPGRAQILRRPSLLRHDSRQLALDLKSLIQHRQARQCAPTSEQSYSREGTARAQDFDPTSTAQTSDARLSEHDDVHSRVLRGLDKGPSVAFQPRTRWTT
ncbi:BZ3500_MvSof-1268-A1-R1_Chr1-3g02437 [Microbotryum saponariae]|uniref:BZ3500_MvSof-1268-A1-R1_Chr1-3g02437 protein n=1 Tax=Microbotryum saponariae TaxID=289078 RepID=A0A2X0MUI5_9BASI|nr:BZ3500_MvSof-1268-A1-R1_Chr1-3g02437 [Microbotryum saponariae]SCZ96224.1 BZ3501_MvSof-1269-A2-R1_Chr1-3g02040 [Microbotryum saponariae]